MPLITADQTFPLSAFVIVVVAFGLWAERQSWGQKLGGPLLLLAISMAAANLGVIPYASPVYDTIGSFLVPVAIPLLLLRADFRVIFSESGSMFVTFLIAATVTIIGSLVGVWAIDMGPLEAEIAGTITSSYIGGSLNFVATAEAVGIKDSSIYVAALSADAVGAVFFLVLLMLLPAMHFVRKLMPSKFIRESDGASMAAAGMVPEKQVQPFNLLHIANGLATSVLVCGIAAILASLMEVAYAFILIVTALALLVANFAKPVLRHVSHEFEIGTLFMYIFFVSIGAGANLGEVLGSAWPILLYIMIMVVVHLVLLLTIASFRKLDLAEVMIASNACILGPPTAAALAASKGWQPLIAPGILVGVFGYAIATFIGVALTAVLN